MIHKLRKCYSNYDSKYIRYTDIYSNYNNKIFA